ncbi:MAG: histidine phosphatase family protein [Pirellulales bacterium]
MTCTTNAVPTLYLMRHAWAEEADGVCWPNDDLRPITPGGRLRFRRMIDKLAKRGLSPGQIFTSPLVRCAQSAAIVRQALREEPAIHERTELAPGGDWSSLLAHSAALAGDIAWMGHAPDVSTGLARLIGGPAASIRFAKGAVAAIAFNGEMAWGQGELRWLATAKMLGID